MKVRRVVRQAASKTELVELRRKYRPRRFEELVGQDETVESLQAMHKQGIVPHSILLAGPPGVGKTTLGQIIARNLGCARFDYHEMNTADYRGIDSIRNIRRSMGVAPMAGPCIVWLIDECHRLTGDAEDAFLKILEEPPDQVYFILCTTEPEKLSRTIRERCMPFVLHSIGEATLKSFVKDIANRESIRVNDEVVETIVEQSEGSARQCLSLLERIRNVKDPLNQIATISLGGAHEQAIMLARKLMDKRSGWSDVAQILRGLQNEEPERIRWMILGYAKTILLKSDNTRAFTMFCAFRDNFYDTKFAGVVGACYEVVHSR